MNIVEHLRSLGACDPGVAWVSAQPDQSPRALWESCPDGSYLLWYAMRTAETGEARRRVALAVCAVVRPALRHASSDVPRETIETVERWAHGDATIEDVRAAAAASDADAAPAACADDYAAARAASLREQADVVRAVVTFRCPSL